MQYYYCSKYVRFPIKDVVLAIYDMFNADNRTHIGLTEIYQRLGRFFNVKSFNRARLAELLSSQYEVNFNTVKELYVKYVIDEEKTEKINYGILRKLFVDHREEFLKVLDVLGFETIKDIILNGAERYFFAVHKLREKDIDPFVLPTNSNQKIILKFIDLYNEEEFIRLMSSNILIEQEVIKFKEDEERKERIANLRTEINYCMENIHDDNLKLKVKYLFGYTLSEILIDCGVKFIIDFKNLDSGSIEKIVEYKDRIINRLKTLQFSLFQKCNEEFKRVLQLTAKTNKTNKFWEKYVKILENRARGQTLEASVSHIGLTRERARQLEKRYLDHFSSFHKAMNGYSNVLRAMVENDLFIQDSDIIKIFPTNPLLYKYFLLNVDNDNIEYSEELGRFYFVDEYRWYDETMLFIERMPEQIIDKDMLNFINDLRNLLCNGDVLLSNEECEKLIMSSYKRVGEVFSKDKMNLTERYRFIWKENFPRIINIYDDVFLVKFKKLYSKSFGDNSEYSERSIIGILTRIGVLCGRGEYVINDRFYMSEDLANRINEYIIDSGKPAFLTNTLFSIFKEELVGEGISNKYFFQGAFKQRFGDTLYFKRDYVSTSLGDFSIYSEVLDFVKESKKLLTYEEIKNSFPGVTDIVLSFALAQEGILWYRKKFIHADNLDIANEDIDYLRGVLTQLVSDNEIHHDSQLMEYIKLSKNDLLKRNFISEHFALFSVVQFLFDDEFEFKRPFIANKNITIGNQAERIKEFVYSKDCCKIDELLDFVYENHMHINGILDCVNSLDEYVFENEACLVPIEKTNINKYNVSIVENIIEKEMHDDFIFVDKLKSISCFPSEVKWTDWLLYSAINKYGSKFNVISSNNKFKQKGVVYAKPIVIKKELGVKDVDQLKEYLKQKTDLSDTEFFVYLRSKGLV